MFDKTSNLTKVSMNILRENSKEYRTNLFADFILTKIGLDSRTVIEIADCENFFVVKGITDSKDILDLNEIKNDFINKFPNLFDEKKLLNTIDLIKYGENIKPPDKMEFQLYNSENCFFEKKDLENLEENHDKIENLIILSQFPFGYSLNMGRLFYYYGKHITYNLEDHLLFENLKLVIPNSDFEKKFEIYVSNYPNDSLKSNILDCFDFNFTWIINELNKVDLSDEIIKAKTDHDFLKRKVENFYLF